MKFLYGLKTYGERFHDLFSEVMEDLGWKRCKAESDIWLRYKITHREYVATYVDDLFYVGNNSTVYYDEIKKCGFKLKGPLELKFHLGGNFKRVDETEATFVNKILKKYEHMFGEPVPKREVHAPLESGDHNELFISRLCSTEQVGQYQSMIVDLQWEVTLGRIDIYCATMTLGSYREAPRIGHLDRKREFIPI